jgi:tetratricopeptide (TPR) repeat protein
MTVELPTTPPDSEALQDIIQDISKKGYLDYVEDLFARLVEEPIKGDLSMLKDLSSRYIEKVKDDTLTLDDVESFIQLSSKLPTVSSRDYILESLYREKAGFLLRQGQTQAALANYEEAIKFNPESPFSWSMKAGSLATLGRFEEAFQAFRMAYDLRGNYLSNLKRDRLVDLLFFWSYVALGLGFIGAIEQDSAKLRKGVDEYLKVIEFAKSEGLEEAVPSLPSVEELERDWHIREGHIKDAFEEFAVAVRLLAIKDPFERIRELAKEVTKVWPEGVSAVEAVREQRDREWNI